MYAFAAALPFTKRDFFDFRELADLVVRLPDELARFFRRPPVEEAERFRRFDERSERPIARPADMICFIAGVPWFHPCCIV